MDDELKAWLERIESKVDAILAVLSDETVEDVPDVDVEPPSWG
jgi:hypothetical protein